MSFIESRSYINYIIWKVQVNALWTFWEEHFRPAENIVIDILSTQNLICF